MNEIRIVLLEGHNLQRPAVNGAKKFPEITAWLNYLADLPTNIEGEGDYTQLK